MATMFHVRFASQPATVCSLQCNHDAPTVAILLPQLPCSPSHRTQSCNSPFWLIMFNLSQRTQRLPLKKKRLLVRRLSFALSTAFLFALIHLQIRTTTNPARTSSIHQTISTTSNFSAAKIITAPFAQHIIVSELSKIVFCPIPKAANSNWKYLIRKWEGIKDFQNLTAAHHQLTSGLRYLSDYSVPEAHQILKDPSYFRFVFVRDPFLRLVSCYMDKFRNEDPEYVQKEYRAFLAQLFGWPYARAVDIQHHPRPSFHSFVHALTKHVPQDMNPHWMPQTTYCGIGIMPYDFFGHMESLQKDVQYVFHRIGRPSEHFPTQQQIGFPPSGASASLADTIYTDDLKSKVRTIYDNDFRLLGYV